MYVGKCRYNPVMYLAECEGSRPDVLIVDQELMGYEWYIQRTRAVLKRKNQADIFPRDAIFYRFKPRGFSMLDFLNHNRLSGRAVVIAGEVMAQDKSWESEYMLYPNDLVEFPVHKATEGHLVQKWCAFFFFCFVPSLFLWNEFLKSLCKNRFSFFVFIL